MSASYAQANDVVCRLVRRMLGPVGVALGPAAGSYYAPDLRDERSAPIGIEPPPGTRLLVVEPIRGADGLPIASIVVADNNARNLSGRDRESLRDIAALAGPMLSSSGPEDRARAERAERLLVNGLDGIALAERGILLDVSPGLARMFGYDRNALVGHSVLELLLSDQHDEFMRIMMSGEARSTQTIGLRADGRAFALEVLHQCLPGEMMCALNFRDLSEQHARERQRSEFFTGMGHELRTPLGSLRAALGILRRRTAGEDVRDLIQIAQSHVEGLARLVSDLVDHESILAGRVLLTLEPTDALPPLQQAVRAAQARAPERDVGIVFDHALGGRRVQADAMRLSQALGLVLDHCLRNAPSGSLVEVGAGVEDDRVVFSMRHAGSLRVPADRLFEPFFGGDSSAEAGQGHTRLGLSLARAIFRRHGGELLVQESGEHGTLFQGDLMVWRSPPALSDGAASERCEVCVLSPDSSQAALVAMLLREGGIAARALPPGENAEVALVRAGASLLIVTDPAGAPERTPPGVRVWLANPDSRVMVAEVRNLLSRRALPGGRPRVLYVEDDPDHAELMVAILAGVADTDCAATLAEARQKLASAEYHVLLTDLGLPDGNGLELVREVDARGAPRVIVFSARTLEEALPRGVRVLTKASVNNEDLRAAVLSMV